MAEGPDAPLHLTSAAHGVFAEPNSTRATVRCSVRVLTLLNEQHPVMSVEGSWDGRDQATGRLSGLGSHGECNSCLMTPVACDLDSICRSFWRCCGCTACR